jgi:hypothetical protein
MFKSTLKGSRQEPLGSRIGCGFYLLGTLKRGLEKSTPAAPGALGGLPRLGLLNIHAKPIRVFIKYGLKIEWQVSSPGLPGSHVAIRTG